VTGETSWSGLRQLAYGVLAVTGLVLTQYFNVTYVGPPGYLQAWFANSASTSAAVDLIVVALAAALFMIAEGRRVGMRVPWLYALGGAVLAIAFTFPLFLLVRERALRRRPRAESIG
jgi:hypothetical protein